MIKIDGPVNLEDHTKGRFPIMNSQQRSYLAGFLDADGSIILQFKKRDDVRFKYRPKTVICFYQKELDKSGLEELRNIAGIGYVYSRNDNMAEWRIEGFSRVREFLLKIQPYLRFKQHQAQLILEAIKILKRKSYSANDLLAVCRIANKISQLNNAPRQRKNTYQSVKQDLLRHGLISP